MSLLHVEPFVSTDNSWVRRERKKRGITMAELARRLEISTSLCSRVERGIIPMTKRLRNEIMEVLEIEPKEMKS